MYSTSHRLSTSGRWSYGGYFDFILDNPSLELPIWQAAREHIGVVLARLETELIPEVAKYISSPCAGPLLLPGPSYGESFYDYERRKQRFALDYFAHVCTRIEWHAANAGYQGDFHALNREIPRFRALLTAIHGILSSSYRVEPAQQRVQPEPKKEQRAEQLETTKQVLQLRPKLAARLEANQAKMFAEWIQRPAAADPVKKSEDNAMTSSVISTNSTTSSGNSSGEHLSHSDTSDESTARSTPTDEQLIWGNDDCETAHSISSVSSYLSESSVDAPESASSAARSRASSLSSHSSASSYVSCLSADAPSTWAIDVEWKPFAVGPAPERRKQTKRRGGQRAKRAKSILFEKVAGAKILCGFPEKSTIIDPADLFGFLKKNEKMDVIDEVKDEENEEDRLAAIIAGMQGDIDAEIIDYFDQIGKSSEAVVPAC